MFSKTEIIHIVSSSSSLKSLKVRKVIVNSLPEAPAEMWTTALPCPNLIDPEVELNLQMTAAAAR